MTEESAKITRRRALIGGGIAAAGAGAAAVVIATSGDDEDGELPRRAIARVDELRPNEPISFAYPLEGQGSLLIDLGADVPGGIGESGGIVAYSSKCQHMGCDVQFVAEDGSLLCPCHQSKYDPAREGNVIQGVAQTPLPRIELAIDGDDIVATGVTGLIYGYRENLAPETPA